MSTYYSSICPFCKSRSKESEYFLSIYSCHKCEYEYFKSSMSKYNKIVIYFDNQLKCISAFNVKALSINTFFKIIINLSNNTTSFYILSANNTREINSQLLLNISQTFPSFNQLYQYLTRLVKLTPFI